MTAKRHLPIATFILIAANIFAAYALLLNPDLAATYGFKVDTPSVKAAFTSLFLHANVVHLLGNMLFLAAVGASVEALSGSFRLFAVYILSGFVGVIVHFIFTPHTLGSPPLIGASGAVAGCVGYYCSRYLQLKIPVVPKLGVTVAGVTAVWLVLQVVGAFIKIGDQQLTTSFWSHIGGFAAGLLISLVFRAPDIGLTLAVRQRLEDLEERGPAAVAHAAEQHLAQHPGDAEVLKELVGALEKLGETDREGLALVQLVEALPESEQAVPALRLCRIGRADLMPIVRRTMLAERLKEHDPDCSRELLESVVSEADEPQRPDAMMSLIALEWDENPVRAHALLDELTERYPLHPAVELARARGWL